MLLQSPIAVRVQPTFREVYWASVLITARQLQKLIWIFAIIVGLLVFVLVVHWWHPRPDAEYYKTLQGVKPLLVAFVIPVVLVFVAPWLATRKVFADPRLVAPATFRFDANGVRIESSIGTSDLNWTVFVASRETKHFFLLYITKARARIIPKRCFADDAEVERFREMICQYIS